MNFAFILDKVISLVRMYRHINETLLHTEFGQNPLLVLAIFSLCMILAIFILLDRKKIDTIESSKSEEDLTWRDVPDASEVVGEVDSFRIPQDAMDLYIDSLLNDPNINISWLPDSIERSMYSYTISLGVSIFHRAFVRGLRSIVIFNHKLQISVNSTKVLQFHDLNVQISHERIELIVKRLSHEKQIQSYWLPVGVEESIFHNLLYLLLKVAFALLSAIHIEVLGNVIRLQWCPSTESLSATTLSPLSTPSQKQSGRNKGFVFSQSTPPAQLPPTLRKRHNDNNYFETQMGSGVKSEIHRESSFFPSEQGALHLDFNEVERAVSEALKEDNSSWLPESVRRVILTAIYSCLLLLAEEVTGATKLKLLTEELVLELRHQSKIEKD